MEEKKAEREFTYQGSLGLLIFWLIWSMGGYFFLVFYKETSTLLEYLYLVSAVGAVMALNNRKYGTNHRIKFFNDHIIVPKLLNIWHWDEEVIFYHDIKEINFHDYAHVGEKNFCEIELKTDMVRYPILGKKMQLENFEDVYQNLLIKTGLKAPGLPPLVENKKLVGLKPWQKKLVFVALVVSVWTISMITLAAPYHNLMEGGFMFFLSFPLAFGLCLIPYFKIKDLESKAQRFQKMFMLFYIAFYGGIGGAFSMVYINGKFDASPTEHLEMVVVNENFSESNQGPCVEMSFTKKSLGRVPASVAQQPTITVCQKNFNNIQVGDQFSILAHKGALGEAWVSKVTKMEKEGEK